MPIPTPTATLLFLPCIYSYSCSYIYLPPYFYSTYTPTSVFSPFRCFNFYPCSHALTFMVFFLRGTIQGGHL